MARGAAAVTRICDQRAADVHKLMGRGMGPGIQPWGTVQEAATIMLDYVREGRYELARPEDLKERTIIAALVKVAQADYGVQYARARPLMRKAWARNHSVLWQWTGGGEHHALCLYCRTSLMTFGKGSGSLPPALTRRLDRHTVECALRGLLPVDDPSHLEWYCPRTGKGRPA